MLSPDLPLLLLPLGLHAFPQTSSLDAEAAGIHQGPPGPTANAISQQDRLVPAGGGKCMFQADREAHRVAPSGDFTGSGYLLGISQDLYH